MTVQVGPGTQGTGSGLIEKEASALTHRTIKPSSHLLCSCTSYGLAIGRFVTQGWNQLIFYCHVQPTLPESTSQAHSLPLTWLGVGGHADSHQKCRECCRFHRMSNPLCRAR